MAVNIKKMPLVMNVKVYPCVVGVKTGENPGLHGVGHEFMVRVKVKKTLQIRKHLKIDRYTAIQS